jgi:hypothetical protein
MRYDRRENVASRAVAAGLSWHRTMWHQETDTVFENGLSSAVSVECTFRRPGEDGVVGVC